MTPSVRDRITLGVKDVDRRPLGRSPDHSKLHVSATPLGNPKIIN